MEFKKLHEWNLTYRAAVELQERLRRRHRERPLKFPVEFVAGADVAYNEDENRLFAAVVVMRLPNLEVVETRFTKCAAAFPYVPGLLSFREIPGLAGAFQKVEHRPDAVIYDGHGVAHPRRFGIAAHLGLLLGIPTVGCAKSRLVGTHSTVGARRWSSSQLIFEDETLGVVLRTRRGVKPVYVSSGHLIDIESAIQLVKMCTTRFRLPEPTRQAHLLVTAYRRECMKRNKG